MMMEKPLPFPQQEFDLTTIAEKCQDYIDFLDDDEEYNEDELSDLREYIFESAMEMVYGKDVWEYVNNRQP